MTEPAWKRNGRNGPLDWWLGCQTHGDQWNEHCMSCGIALDHNIDFKARLEREKAAAGVKTGDQLDADVARLMAMSEAEIDAELRSMGMDPAEAERQGKAAVEGALAAIHKRTSGVKGGGNG